MTGSIPNTPTARGSECTALALRKLEKVRAQRFVAEAMGAAIGGLAASVALWGTLDEPVCFGGRIRRVGNDYEKVLVGPRVYVDALLDRIGEAAGAVDLRLARHLRAGRFIAAMDRAVELGPVMVAIVDDGCSEIVARIMVGCT